MLFEKVHAGIISSPKHLVDCIAVFVLALPQSCLLSTRSHRFQVGVGCSPELQFEHSHLVNLRLYAEHQNLLKSNDLQSKRFAILNVCYRMFGKSPRENFV